MESINGYVYFIATEDFSFFKIGFSEDPPKRLQRAQVDCPLKLILYKQIPGSRRLEQKIQYHLGSHWVRGEWFKFSEDLLDHIYTVISEN